MAKSIKKRSKSYLGLYKKWMKDPARFPYLCWVFTSRYNESLSKKGWDDELFELFIPDDQERAGQVYQCWGQSTREYTDSAPYYNATPLRQTIVLLMAAMNNEL